MLAARLSSDGDFQWERLYGDPLKINSASQIVLDKSGNIIVAGYGMDADTGYETALLKLKPSGATIFAKHTGQTAGFVYGLYASSRTDDFYLINIQSLYNSATQLYVSHYAFAKYYPRRRPRL